MWCIASKDQLSAIQSLGAISACERVRRIYYVGYKNILSLNISLLLVMVTASMCGTCFPQVSDVAFSFDPIRPLGSRIGNMTDQGRHREGSDCPQCGGIREPPTERSG